MGSGGFLLTNYQMEFEAYFERGVDYEYYEDYDDLQRKVEYYLTHDKERMQIAENGREKVKKYHTYKQRVDAILEIIV